MPHAMDTDSVAPEEALLRLREGNARFVAGEGGQTDAQRVWHPSLTDAQRPFAVILGCSDSRAPAEYLFDQGLGDLFVIRVAGNIIAPSLVGSVEFAVGKFGVRLVVVMGHTQCGAVAATVEALQHGGMPESSNLKSIVDFIKPNIEYVVSEPEFLEKGEDEAVTINAIASARRLREASEILRGMVESGHVQVVPAVFHLATGKVIFLNG